MRGRQRCEISALAQRRAVGLMRPLHHVAATSGGSVVTAKLAASTCRPGLRGRGGSERVGLAAIRRLLLGQFLVIQRLRQNVSLLPGLVRVELR